MGTHRAIQVISCWQVFKGLIFSRVSYPLGRGILPAFFLAVLKLFSACDEKGGKTVAPDNSSLGTVTGFSATAGDDQNFLPRVNPTDSEITGNPIFPRNNDVIPTGPTPCWSLESLWKSCGVDLWNKHLFATPQFFTT